MPRILLLAALLAVACKSTSKRAEESAPEFTPAPDDWASYPATINDAPASVLLNLSYGERAPIRGFGHLLWVFVDMHEPGAHGMGTSTESEQWWPLEEGLGDRVRNEVQAHYVGRIRGEGTWQLYFYGRSADRFADVVSAFMREHPDWKFTLGDKAEPGWKTFREVIYPDAERLAWIGDNSVVEQLRKGGDPLTEPRRVDHWIYFDRADQRDAFETDVKALGFSTEQGAEGADEDGKLGLRVHRVDHVDVDRIHAVVMELTALATKHRGEYDGWETAILKPTAAPPPAAAAPTDREPG